jgi:hypothetical protein
MADLIIKSQNENTIRTKRLKALADGESIQALMEPYSGINGAGVSRVEAVGVSDYGFGDMLADGNAVQLSGVSAIAGIERPYLSGNVNISRMASGMDIKMDALGGKTVRQAVLDKDILMDGNSLIGGWNSLWDAMRIDLTIRKLANPTVREFIYNIMDTPNADATMNVTEYYPHFVEFQENNGTGESVELAELMGGQTDTMSQVIYAAGLNWDLKKELFDRTLNMGRINDGVAVAEGGKKDDIALSPIFGFTYAAEAQTAADTAGATREEKLYNTLVDAQEDMMKRRDPITQKRLSPVGVTILAGPIDAMHIQQVSGGFQGTEQNVKLRPALSWINRIVGYEGERMVGRTKTVTYTDVPTGKAYMIIPNRYMMVGVKRNLQLDVDRTPDVRTLSRQQMAWWYCEALYNAGIQWFIQEITLPAW